MEIKNPRLRKLISKFQRMVSIKMGMSEFDDFLDYPGGIVMVTKKVAGQKHQNAAAYTRQISGAQKIGDDIVSPRKFKIFLIKEEAEKLSDKEFLHLLAHEYSHILIRCNHNKLEDWACETLAGSFFGYRKPKGSTLGYLYDKKAFEEIYGKHKI